MFLKSIELFGFKSFADRSRIEFTDGVSALLGPNGCGKSNVVDGIKWVLGEQATKSLRAERMEDVIFNGTEGRKALNVAEVTLVLANDNGLLPIDSAEIAVRRRLFRDGESEYYINGTLVRLREVRELFYDTGIGKTAYSIMEQGKIDQVLSTKPEERRQLFEEAAGITKYKARGRDAERKLERTEENMRQAQSILGEVSRSHENLRKQSEKTAQYRELRAQAFEVERDLTLLRLRGLVERRDRRTEQREKKQESRDSLRSGIDKINETLEESLDNVNEMEAGLIEQQRQLYGVELEKKNRENQIRIHEDRVEELTQKIAGAELRASAITERIASLQEQIGATRAEMDEHRERIVEVDSNVQRFQEHVEHAEQRIKTNQHESGQLNGVIAEQEKLQVSYEVKLRELTDDIVQKLDDALAGSGYSRAQRSEYESTVREALARIASLRQRKDAGAGADGQQTGAMSDAEILETIFADTEVAIDAFEHYRSSIPSFLDEFVAPEGIITQKRELDTALSTSRELVRSSREKIDELRQESEGFSGKVAEYRETLEQLRVNRVRMATQLTGMEATLSRHEEAAREQQTLLAQHRSELEGDRQRLVDTQAKIGSLGQEIETLSEQGRSLQAAHSKLQETISSKNKQLKEKERKLKEQMEALGKAQSELEKLQIGLAETSAEIRTLYETFRDRFSEELANHEPRMLEIDTSAADLREELAKLKDAERNLGAVNLAAPEEFAEVAERYTFLSEQLEDLTRARDDLLQVTREIQSESAALFTRTYEQIKHNFHAMFRRLFGGGRAEIKLSDPDNILESGVEMYVQPPGKKLENIALLSGGERSLTAVALLFATYMVRPSPFCLLDEIDAALDESNVGRFTAMLMEFAETSQFIVITHNKKTVAAARTLLGVTMEEHGISKVVSIRIGGEAVRA